MCKPKLIGGIGEINFGKQFRQGNRIYDSNEIAMCLMSSPIGNSGGYSYLYQVYENNIKIERGSKLKEFKNDLIKYEFNMDAIKLFDSFAGIGALHQSLNELGVPTELVGISEIDIDAIISYAAIHIDNFKDVEFEYPTEEIMKRWLMDRNIGYSFEKQKSSIPRLKKDKLYKVYKASVLLNNLGDISTLDYNNMIDFDLFNFSFPCTDLSGAGKQKGLVDEDGTPTRSGLVKYGIEIIKTKKPKYIMIENVKALIQKKFINDFYNIVNEIEGYGYHCYYPTKEDKKGNKLPMCLNAKDYGVAQNRERIFVICVRDDIDNESFEFPQGFDNGLRLKDFLEDGVNEKYYLNKEYNDRFKESLNNQELQRKIPHDGVMEALGTTQPIDAKGTNCRHWVHNDEKLIGALSATDYKQPKQIVDRIGGVFGNHQAGSIYNSNSMSPTIDTMQGGYRQPCVIDDKYYLSYKMKKYILDLDETQEGTKWDGRANSDSLNLDIAHTLSVRSAGGNQRAGVSNFIINDYDDEVCVKQIKDDNKNNIESLRIRKLTPKECWRLMGFRDECFEKAEFMGLSDSALYKQAGNSIVVNCLYYIFKSLFQEYITK